MKRSIKIMLGVILGLVVILALFLIRGDFVQGLMRPAYNENKCYDSDGGQKYDVKGTTYGKILTRGKQTKTQYADYCDGDALVEYYCEGTKVKKSIKESNNGESCYLGEIVGWDGYCLDSECNNKNPTFVIITRPLFIDAIQDFVEWKITNGFTVGVLTLEYINQIYSEGNPAKNMKEEIKNFANNHSTKYFLLIGDTISSNSEDGYDQDVDLMYNMANDWNVPSGYFCSKEVVDPDNDGINNYSPDCINPTDIYYADFNDEDWKENEDGYIVRGSQANSYWYDGSSFKSFFGSDNTVWGYSEVEESELDFETIVARIPIREPEEFSNIFNKIKNFEPVDTVSLLMDVTLMDESEIDGDEGSNYKTFCSYPGVSADELATYLTWCADDYTMLKNLVQNESGNFVYETFNIDSVVNGSDGYVKAKNKLLNETNIVIPFFHGGHSSIGALYEDDVGGFENIFPAWIMSSCSIGTFAFGTKDSLVEVLIKGAKGPAFLIKPLNKYYFFKDSLEGKTVGEAFYNPGKVIFRKTGENQDNLIGDPSLKIFSLD
ncbi:MAG: C25 family cysteine peptidase [Candidatus Gracilibacteria bacterium]